ncbi:hypothetical protein LCGC14_0701890 [marine sediment metagenome]|uniref:Uncharacterized protein n=1 Tax=marine sediment metagenome TaxID=412755 RepID=A0A0F9R2W8_9ZZZZ
MSESVFNGKFTSGKFAGQPVYAPYFWDQVKRGMADDKNGNVYLFDITPKDVDKFSDLDKFEVVRLYDDGNGFVTVEAGYDDED